MDPKIQSLIKNLLSKTKNRESLWEKTRAKTDRFTINLEYGLIHIDKLLSSKGYIVYQFVIFNSNGDSIINIHGSNGELNTIQEFDALKELYEAIKHSYYKVDDTINGLISETSKEGGIGKKLDDGLPF